MDLKVSKINIENSFIKSLVLSNQEDFVFIYFGIFGPMVLKIRKDFKNSLDDLLPQKFIPAIFELFKFNSY